jgi:hypothetical protein
MLKFKFNKVKELEEINNRFSNEDSIDYDNWHLMNEEETLITDAAMFEDEAYCDNKFNSIEEFVNNVIEEEGDSYQNTLNRIEQMLDRRILTIVDLV